jgi:hypothetical protein
VVNNLFAEIQWFGIGFSNGALGGVAKNNIFYDVGTSLLLEGVTAEWDYNLYFNAGGSGGGANDVTGDPMFVDAAGDDYHLQAGSPAIDAGTDVGVALDLEGNARPALSGYDIGPYEFQPGAAERSLRPSRRTSPRTTGAWTRPSSRMATTRSARRPPARSRPAERPP